MFSRSDPSRQHYKVLEKPISVNSESVKVASTLNLFVHFSGLSQKFEIPMEEPKLDRLPRDFANLRPEPENFKTKVLPFSCSESCRAC